MIGSDDAIPRMLLERIAPGSLAPADVRAIRGLRFEVEAVGPGRMLARDGEPARRWSLLVSGYACRHKTTSGGGRQIMSFHIPGDMLDLQHMLFAHADHNIETISDAMIAWVPQDALRALIAERPAIAGALWREAMIEAAIFREWMLNVGRRDARGRIAHMLCEFATRCEAAGIGAPERLTLPMTQEHIADATGLTPVHVNRMLRALRAEGVISGAGKYLRIADPERLREVAAFNPAYLHPAARAGAGSTGVRRAASASFR